MAQVRCPMCGILNPEDAEVCLFCQARLKPLTVSNEAIDSSRSEETHAQLSSPEESGSISEWLQSLRSEEEDQPENQLSSPGSEWRFESNAESLSAEDQPDQDWLAALREDGEQVEAGFEEVDHSIQYTGEESPGNEEVIPAWLAELRSASEESPVAEPSVNDTETDLEVDEEPEWLQQIHSAEAPQVDTSLAEQEFLVEAESAAKSEGEAPQVDTSLAEQEFLVEAESATKSEGEAPQVDTSLAEQEFLVEAESATKSEGEGLEAIGQEPQHEAVLAETLTGEDTPPETQESEIACISEGETKPDWLAGLPASKEDEEIEEEESLPDWLRELKSQDAAVIENPDLEGEKDGSEVESHPERLAEIIEGVETAGSVEEEVIPESFEGSIPPFTTDINELFGELPVWMEDIHPADSATPGTPIFDDKDKRIESAGPLMGMKGALPAEPDIAQQKNPPRYSTRLQVSEKQKTVAAQIEVIIKSESESQPLSARPIIGSQTVLRVAIFLVLLLAILIPMITGTPIAPLPMYTAQAYDFSQAINQLPGAAPVLLAFDYEPGLSGEIEAISTIVLDHLMVKGAFLTLVSTVPTGPLQAERLIAAVNTSGGHKYQANNQYIDMGYIPGGQSGLIALAENPRQIIPYSAEGDQVWEKEPIQNIHTVSDFALVIVLTDNPDDARAWIEQVQPGLGGTPLIMAISAQAEPIVQPYYISNPRQVAGIVAGLMGGASYEKLVPRTGLASQYWNSFSFATFAAVVLVILGSVASVFMLWMSLRKHGKLEAE